MSRRFRTTSAALGLLLLATGCATKAQLRRGLADQAAALQAERAERSAADERLAGDLGRLNSDLAGLKTDFGARFARLEDGLQIAMPVNFAFGQAEVRSEVQPALDRFAEVVLRQYPGSTITVEGFTDPAGSAAYNRRLSQMRAQAVRQYLSAKGIPETQLRVVGYGEARPVVPGAAKDEFGADLNRRVVFVVETPAHNTQTAVR